MKMILTACLSLALISGGAAFAQNEPEVTVEAVVFSEQELDQMLAPIALYPDTVLAHILIAATYPLEVVQAARWTERNPDLEGDEALKAVDDEDWDPSVKALVAFPDILQRMSEDLDWTQRLGDAFLDDEARITASIQKLRQHAYDEGNLKDVEHVKVVKENETIVIEPAVREVVYVPYYDTRYIYGHWWWDAYPPVYWHHPHYHNTYTSFYWGPRVYLSSGFFFSGFHWHNRHIVVIDHHHHRSHNYYSSRQVVRHRDAYRWQHNPRHRRGVDYVNPRTRDYFESRKRNSAVTANYRDSNQPTNVSRNSRDIDNSGNSLRTDNSRRNADFVRERLRSSDGDAAAIRESRSGRGLPSQTDSGSRTSRQQFSDNKGETGNRGNIKLRDGTVTTRNSDADQQRQPQANQSEDRERVVREYRNQSPVQRIERGETNEAKRETNVREQRVQRQPEQKSEPAQRAQRTESQRSERASSAVQRSVERQRSSGGDGQRSSRSGSAQSRRER
jgi:hypothetical protein